MSNVTGLRVSALVLLLAVPACDARAVPTQGAWKRIEGFPLSARTDAIVAWTGTEVVVVGGNTGPVCPPNASCAAPTALAADGAAWNPDTGEWREIADAPEALLSGWYCEPCSAVVGGRVLVNASDDQGEQWLAYDPVADEWQRLDPPGAEVDLAQNDGERIWGFRGRSVVAWDPVSGVEVELTYDVASPLQDRKVVLTDDGPVVTGVRYHDAAPDEPTLTMVDVPDGKGGWRRVETGQIGRLRHWSGERLVGVEPGGADGGEVNGWDRSYPYAGAVDPLTGAWEPVDVPGYARDSWTVNASAGPLVVTGGQFVDLRRLEWTAVGRPPSDLDAHLGSTFVGESLFVLGGVDEDEGYDSPSGPEAWLWTPPE